MRLMTGLALFAIFPVAYLFRPLAPDEPIFSACMFRAFTGKSCLFCGMTRAFTRMTHGEFTAASQFNPLWWFAALIIGVIGIIAVLDAITGADALGWLGRKFTRWWWLLVLALLGGTILRAIIGG